MKKLGALAIVVVVAIVGAAAIVTARSNATSKSTTEQVKNAAGGTSEAAEMTGKAADAIERAASENKYLFVFFRKDENDQTASMRRVFNGAMIKVTDRANSIEIDIADGSEKSIVDKYGLDRAPMPLALALAPNGAITGGFPTEFKEEQLLEAFATPCTEKCMKHLQDGRLVFLCVQNESTKSNAAALKGVRDFEADDRYASATEVVLMDPADSREADFLADLQISPKSGQAMTVFLAPPGSPIAVFEGATEKEQLVQTLQQASSACGPGGCGPGGCGPSGCAPR